MGNEFLDELRNQFARLIESKSQLDNKAGAMITMSGMISTLLMGFGVFLLRSINHDFVLFFWLFAVLIIGIILVITTISLAVWSYKLRDQWYPIGSDLFFTCNKLDWKEINAYMKATDDDFQLRMIADYLDSIKDVEQHIEDKGRLIKLSQWFFLTGIFTIPLIVSMVIVAISMNMLQINPIM